MDAILLAAGLGTRLRPHTLTTPKPLLPVQGRPILDWTLAALPECVDRIIVVVNYLAEQIEDYLSRQSYFRDYVVVRQREPKGTGDALRRCATAVRSENFLVINGDDLFAATDLKSLARAGCGLLAYPVDEPKKFGIVFTRPDGTLERLLEKPDLEGRFLANTGAYAFPRWVFDFEIPLSPRGEYEITDCVSYVAERSPFHVIKASFWFPIGTEEAWRNAQEIDLSAVVRKR